MPEGSRPFGNDRPLLWNIEPWNELGFAVPNFSNKHATKNMPLWTLADEIGKAQLFVMTRVDAQREQYPSINCVQSIGKLINRVKATLGNRKKASGDLRLEERHASADSRPWNLHPVPYYRSDLVKNRWLSEYNHLVMVALTNIYQHSDNNLALTITEEFANEIWAYCEEIAILVGTELLGLPKETVLAEGFEFNEVAYAGYSTIARRTSNFEALRQPGPVASVADEYDLADFFEGVPSVMALTSLAEYPSKKGVYSQGQDVAPESEAPGVSDGSLISEPAGHLGQPQT